ncbi:quaternary amine ABC transporter ATP-binding protein [Kushneria aurantia]|uniref:Quaternary amine transport ATP-binding protein n=1 Tax=Kushneria aurantia TaxID=504092 RepID=A0ABV6G3Y9_9GAMM|nr:glycine betaine/L-proline ABC transporter ATP-binding protein [Kushneria aurantia]
MSDEKAIKIRVKGLTKVFGDNPEKAIKLRDEGYGRTEILKQSGQTLGLSNIDFDVYEGELLVIMGLSGSGKSTLIRCLNRLIEPTEGDIVIDGENIPTLDEKALRECRRRHFSMVFQHFALFPHRSVRRNAEYGLEVRGVDSQERHKKADDALKQVGLEGWEDAMPSQLSGGMQQRVGLARALANDASVLLMDEAFSALDPLIKREMQQELIELQERTRKTTIFITHDLDEAINIADRIVLLKDGEVVQIGTPEQILTAPADDYVARFVEGVDMTRILTAEAAMKPVRATARDDDGPRTALYKMRENSLESIYVVDSERRLLGIVTAEQLGKAEGVESIRDLVDSDCPKVGPDEPLQALFGMFEQRNYPIAVIDEQARLKGVVVRGAVIEQLARAGDKS